LRRKEMEWENFIKDHKSLDNATLKVRTSDNVLDDEDYSIDIIGFCTGIIIWQHSIKDGVYPLPNMVGWDTIEFSRWIAEDWTGSHPENYNEYIII
jgi:hypothetical protein